MAEPTVQEMGRLNGLGGGDVLGWELSALQGYLLFVMPSVE